MSCTNDPELAGGFFVPRYSRRVELQYSISIVPDKRRSKASADFDTFHEHCCSARFSCFKLPVLETARPCVRMEGGRCIAVQCNATDKLYRKDCCGVMYAVMFLIDTPLVSRYYTFFRCLTKPTCSSQVLYYVAAINSATPAETEHTFGCNSRVRTTSTVLLYESLQHGFDSLGVDLKQNIKMNNRMISHDSSEAKNID